MVSIEYSEAAVEVLDILNYTRKEDLDKIPKKFIEFLEKNKSKTYISNLDHTKPISEMNLKQKTEAILGLIYMKYWADEQGKIEFQERIEENETKYQKELKEKYNPDNIFRNRINEQIKSEDIQIAVVKKETFWAKILNKIKNIFRR